MSARVKYNLPFPMLKTPDIVMCLQEGLGIRIPESDLQKPSAAMIMRLYENIADQLTGLQYGKYKGIYEDPERLQSTIEETMDHPELHQDSLPMVVFYHGLAKLMEDVMVPEFSLNDLIRPEPGRTRMILSALINFARFREEKLVLFGELSKKSEEYNATRNELLEKNSVMTDDINAIRLQRTEEQPEVDHLKKIVDQLSTELKQLKAAGDGVNSEVARLKQEKSELQKNVENSEILLTHTKQDIVRLRSLIVKNPEQLKQTIHDLGVSVSQTRASMEEKESVAREMESKTKQLAEVENDLAECIKTLEECEKEYKKLQDAEQLVAKQKDALARKQAELREASLKEQSLRRQQANVEDKLQRMQSQLLSKQDSMESRLNDLREEWKKVGAEHMAAQEAIEKYNQEISEQKAKVSYLETIELTINFL